ncbi:MAG: hypothetical protein HYY97_11840, partial [Rhodocyclales bacterium]|nr:hypothetical protein [Rhodocyclales bacterium]
TTVVENYAYVDTPVLTLRDSNGVVATPLAANPAATVPDAGSTLATDPIHTYELSTVGTYTVEVGALRHYLQPNPFASDGYVGYGAGQSYNLNISLQRHDTNKDAISLVGKQVTLTTGANKGTSARILAYDAATKTYTLDKTLTGAVGATDRFNIEYNLDAEFPNYTSNSDTFQVVLSKAPTDTVTLDVLPQVTATYNSNLAFSARDNYGQTESIQVDTATPQAKVELTGTAVIGQVWRLTLNDVNYNFTAASTSLSDIASGLKGVIDAANAGYTVTVSGSTLTVSRYAGDHGAFTTLLAVLPYSDGSATISQLTPSKVEIDFAGQVKQGERWTIALNGTSYFYDVQYGDDLGAVTLNLYNQLRPLTTLRTSLTGLVLTVANADQSAMTASYTVQAAGAPTVMLPASTAGGKITSQLVFSQTATDWNGWNRQQTVTVTARDDQILEGHDLKVFPAMGERINTIRGPLIIDGGAQYSDVGALNEPFMTAGETNWVLPNSTITSFGWTTATVQGQSVTVGTLTDTHITHVDSARGEMPGLDPRMNDFAYQITVINSPGVGTPMDLLLGGLKGDTLALKAEDGTSTVQVTGLTVGGTSLTAGVDYSIRGKGAANMIYSSADVVLKGDVFKDSVWEINANGTLYTYTAGSRPSGATADDVLTLDKVAERLSEKLITGGYSVTRTGHLMEITRGSAFTFGFTTGKGNGNVTGTPVGTTGDDWLLAEIKFASTVAVTQGQSWTISLQKTGEGSATDYTYVVRTGDTLKEVILGLADQIDVGTKYHSDIKYETATFTTDWPTTAGHLTQDDMGYFITPVNRNFLVIEEDQVDVLNAFNRSSVSDDAGVLTDSRLTGFGMGGDTIVAGKAVKGGISYQGLEQFNLMLGSGNDRLTIESTHLGSTTVTGGVGNDTITLKTIGGHTFVDTGTGADIVNVGSDLNVVDQITGLLAIDQGGDTGDVLNVIDSGDAKANTATLTASTLTGLDMPTVAEVQTIRVQAKSGTFRLGLDPTLYVSGAPYGATQTVSYDAVGTTTGVTDLQTALRTLYGTTELIISEVSRDIPAGETQAHAITYAMTFTGTMAGKDMPKLVWMETRNASDVTTEIPLTSLVAYDNESVDLKVTTKRDGSTAPVVDNVQTFAVNADGGSFKLTVNVPQPGNTTVLAQATAAIAYNATAAEIRTALDPILNPNGSILDPFNPRNDNSRPYTNNVTVTRVGNVVTIAFQGEHRGKAVTAVDSTLLTNTAGTASIDVATRHSGINYYGVGTLNLTLGTGDDIFNVQGTSSITNLNTAAGNDRVIVSSNANVNTGNLVTLRSGETADLGFRLTEAAASVSIDVKDSSGAIVRTFALGATAAGDYSQAWDGKDTAGNLVSAGTYTYTVTGKRTVSSFVMNSGDTPTLAFSLAEAATAVTIDVTDTSGTLVKTISLGETAAGA